MTKNELMTNISIKIGIPKTTCEKVIDNFAEEVKKCLVAGDSLLLKDFMSFKITERAEHKGKDVRTGEEKIYPASKSVNCKVSKKIKDAVKGK